MICTSLNLSSYAWWLYERKRYSDAQDTYLELGRMLEGAEFPILQAQVDCGLALCYYHLGLDPSQKCLGMRDLAKKHSERARNFFETLSRANAPMKLVAIEMCKQALEGLPVSHKQE
jgi:hypothetical protein